MEWDGLDDEAVHAIAFSDDHLAIGYARLLNTKQLGRMAVLPQYRRQGVGCALLLQLENEARNRQFDHIFLHAQVQALPFYERQGYATRGGPFDEAGIPHMLMTKLLGSLND
jgi:predicted GNAT family N-acyltransferase